VRITDGDPMKLDRMLEIQSWFDNKGQLAATAASMAKYPQQSEKAAILLKNLKNVVSYEYKSAENGILREETASFR